MKHDRLGPLAAGLVAILFSACGDGAAAGDAGSDADPGDPSAAMFDPDRLLEISITLAPADWDLLRHQHQQFEDAVGEDCQSRPPPRPYSYFTGDVTIDGVTIATVGLRKKGFLGSVNAQRPSLKIKFDEYVAGQEYAGLERLTLNNNQQDGSQVNQCLSYAVFAAAGVPSPRCNFAHVTVNGVDLGIYSHVESLQKRFLARHFADPNGNLYEGTGSDFRPGWVATFQKKTNEIDPDRSDLDAVVAAAAVADDELEAALSPLVDLDELDSFWAVEALVGHWDGYANNLNNYFVYHDPESGRFHFIPWGPDSTFGGVDPFVRYETPTGLYANGMLAHRRYQLATGHARHRARLAELLDTVWDETALLAEVDRMAERVGDHVHVAPAVFAAELDRVRDFVTGRRAALTATLDSDPGWDHPLRSTMCFEVIGRVDATFLSPWGEFQPAWPFGNPATMTLELDGVAASFTLVGAGAGPTDDFGGDRNGVGVYGLLADNTVLLAAAFIDPEEFAPGELPVDGYTVAGVLISAGIDGASQRLMGFLHGTITLDRAGTASASPVSGTLGADILGFGFWKDE